MILPSTLPSTLFYLDLNNKCSQIHLSNISVCKYFIIIICFFYASFIECLSCVCVCVCVCCVFTLFMYLLPVYFLKRERGKNWSRVGWVWRR